MLNWKDNFNLLLENWSPFLPVLIVYVRILDFEDNFFWLLHMFQIWSLYEGLLLRSITFPSIIDAIVMDLGEHVFYAGGRDGKIYIAALNAECNRNSIHGMFIIGALYDHRSQYAVSQFW